MNKVDLVIDVTNTLNHNGFDRVTVDGVSEGTISIVSPRCDNCDFTIRVGYWDRIDSSLIETIKEYHSIRMNEVMIEDGNTGTLYRYECEIL